MQLQFSDILIIILVLVGLIVVGLYYYNRKTMKKVAEADAFIEQNKMTVPIFVIDKKMVRPTSDNLPKNIYEQLPKTAKIRKMAIIKAKVGPQIVTLTCDKNIFDVLQTKKTTKVNLAGIFIISIPGMNLENKKKKTWREKLALYAGKGRNQ